MCCDDERSPWEVLVRRGRITESPCWLGSAVHQTHHITMYTVPLLRCRREMSVNLLCYTVLTQLQLLFPYNGSVSLLNATLNIKIQRILNIVLVMVGLVARVLLSWVRLEPRSTLQLWKSQLIGMSQWYCSTECGHPLLTQVINWTYTAVQHTDIAPP